eukprot:TRINITY_DN2544_c1_g2_i2.p1 TRINITY_DN2544_c1_g2~~TRINITY_DN2544_c1_g2_i2.p1  ORF type:complete len:513 (+),score=129.86 TRINITY_DN2544_c1_g2_i2:208-1539(+)
MLPAESTGIEVGDRLVAINDIRVEKMMLHDAAVVLSEASLPKRLTFKSTDSLERKIYHFDENDKDSDTYRAVNGDGILRIFAAKMQQLGQTPLMTAEFGGIPSCGNVKISVAHPQHGCSFITNVDEVEGSYAIIQRGLCPFLAKTRNLQDAGAAGVIIINNDGPNLEKIKRGDQIANDIQIPVVMVSQTGMGSLMEKMNQQPISRKRRFTALVELDESKCGVTVSYDEDAERDDEDIDDGSELVSGIVIFENLEKEEHAEFLAAEFSENFPIEEREVVLASPRTACDPLSETDDYEGKFVIVSRGVCPFEEKVENILDAGGFGMIVVNNEPGLAHMVSDGDKKGLIPAVMITKTAESSILKLFGKGTVTVDFHGDLDIADKWQDLEAISNPDAWPNTFRGAKKLYHRLSRVHHPDKATGSRDRFEYLRQSYEKVKKRFQRDEL